MPEELGSIKKEGYDRFEFTVEIRRLCHMLHVCVQFTACKQYIHHHKLNKLSGITVYGDVGTYSYPNPDAG